MQLDAFEAALVHGSAHLFGKVSVPALLIVATKGVQFQSMHMPQS